MRVFSDITAVVPVYNAAATLEKTLLALKLAGIRAQKIIVVSDAATDSSSEIAARQGTRIFSLNERSGAGRARNTGADHARTRFILFCDADVEIRRTALASARRRLLKNPGISGIQGVYSRTMRRRDAFSSFKHARQLCNIFALGSGKTPVCGSALLLMRRSDFETAGGFPAFWKSASSEDRILGQKLYSMGKPLFLSRRLQGVHDHRFTAAAFMKTQLFRARHEIAYGHLLGKAKSYVHPLFRLLYLISALSLAAAAAGFFFPFFRIPAAAGLTLVILTDLCRLRSISRFFHPLWPLVSLIDHICVVAGATLGMLDIICHDRSTPPRP